MIQHLARPFDPAAFAAFDAFQRRELLAGRVVPNNNTTEVTYTFTGNTAGALNTVVWCIGWGAIT